MQRSKSVKIHHTSSAPLEQLALARSAAQRAPRLKPLALAAALLLASGGGQAQQAFSGAWFAGKGAQQGAAAASGRLPNGQPVAMPGGAHPQQQRAGTQLQQSLNNLQLAARGIAAAQAAQAAARQAALAAGGGVPDGLGDNALKVDTNSLTAGWINANAPAQSAAGGKTAVTVVQTADKAILNWESFNIGKNTTLQFEQKSNWSVLNRVNDPLARPSQIQGQIKADGTVMIVNRNGVVFSGSSQVDTRNLVAAAMGMSNAQFNQGLYGDKLGAGAAPSFANDLELAAAAFKHGKATADVKVEAGASIATRAPTTVTEGGGYVLLAGRGVGNAGAIATPGGQATLAAGDAVVVRKGMGTDTNPHSSTRGNEVEPLFAGAGAGKAGAVVNAGLIQAGGGDITLSGNTVRQAGVLLSSTSVNGRGSVHLAAAGAAAGVTLAPGSVSAIVLADNGASALDVQREALLKVSDKSSEGIMDRRDQSLLRIASAGDVAFEGGSLTLATGGQVLVDAGRRSHVARGAAIDVAGAVGVQMAMASNNVLVNVQGNEQRDAAPSRDAKYLNNSDVWVDRRDLVLVPAGGNGYPTDRWYTAGGLLEVGGYLNTAGHGIGEWAAQGGTVAFGGAELVTQAGSRINVAGGSLDVQTGLVKQTWLKGADGQLYQLGKAPGDNLYSGLYRGFESAHARWGEKTTESFRNPLIGHGERLENGYTVGRDAGRVVVATGAAVLEGDIDTAVFQGERQQRARDAGLDSYKQAQTAAARAGQLVVGQLAPVYDAKAGMLRDSPQALLRHVDIGAAAPLADTLALADALPSGPAGTLRLDAAWLNGLELGALSVYALDQIALGAELGVAGGGAIALHANHVALNANLSARGGSIAAGNLVQRYLGGSGGGTWVELALPPPDGAGAAGLAVGAGVRLDARGLSSDQRRAPGAAGLAHVDGGKVTLKSSGDISLAAGSVVDVSSGAAVQADGALRGGRGGDITLAVDVATENGPAASVLRLDGSLLGHGVKGGGRLVIENGSAVSIGGALADAGGVLAAGSKAGVNLRLAEELQIAAGERIPIDFALTVSGFRPGHTLERAIEPAVTSQRPLRVGADWQVPPGTAVQEAGGAVRQTGYVVPAGTALVTITRLEAGYTIPAAAFPDGVPVQPFTQRYAGGSVAAADVGAPVGSLIRAGQSLDRAVAVKPLLALDASLFRSGFADYAVTGHDGLVVVDGARVEVAMPLLRPGSDAGAAPQLWTPQLYQEDARKARLGQRAGADLTLTAGSRYVQSALTVGEGAVVGVDPGRQLTLQGNGQISVDGRLDAWGGKIAVLPGALGVGNAADRPNGTPNPTSIWIGERAVLDAAGRAAAAVDAQGRRYGRAGAGGSIEIGARYLADAGQVDAADAFVVVRPGARLDASGAAATVDLPGKGAGVLAGAGGLIALSSYNGIYADGSLRAAAGGAGAAGGTLALALETPNYGMVDRQTLVGENVDNAVRLPRELVLSRLQGDSALAAGLRPGERDAALRYGQARLGADRVRAGGFDNLALLSNGLITFDGELDLSLGQSLRLNASALALAHRGDAAQVRLAAPHLRLAGVSRTQIDDHIMPNPVRGSKNAGGGAGTLGVPLVAAGSALLLEGGLVDVAGAVGMGARGDIVHNGGTPLAVERDAFDQLTLRSSGDLRLSGNAVLHAPGNVTLAAAQIYPAAGDSGTVVAGQRSYRDEWGNLQVKFDPARSLSVESAGAAPAAQPYSAFGSLSLLAATVNQGGVLRAPLGQINLGGDSYTGNTGHLNLLPGSVTSVSAHGLVLPYGGSLDGLSYMYNGTEVALKGVGNGPLISLAGAAIDVRAGAVLDMSGGGELKGAAFLAGRGGSTDARLNPLVQMQPGGGFTLPGLRSNPVYAIVPGAQAGQAPLLAENGAGNPMVGRQISIGAGVPGLPAGTYTLLPSTFALLPGAFRVELNGLAGAAPADATVAMRNGSFAAPATTGVAGTAIRDAVPGQVILTPAAVLRSYSQYNETSYAAFALAQAQRDGVPRAALERDAKALRLQLVAPATLAVDDAAMPLRMAGSALYTPAEGGFGGSVLLGTGSDAYYGYEILADGASATPDFPGISVHASQLNAIGAQRMGIGGMPQVTYAEFGSGSNQRANIARFTGSASSIVLRDGAVLKAAEVFLVTGKRDGGITVEQGAGINTLGRGKAAWDSRDGYVYEAAGAVLAVSNGWLDILAPGGGSENDGPGAIDIGACAAGAGACAGTTELYSDGSIAAITDRSFTLRDNVRYGTRNLALSMGAINVGAEASLAAAAARGALPNGLTLNQGVLDRLLRGDAASGAPALESLALTARDSVNFFDSAQLSTIDPASGKSSLARLVLGTPAIYGHGGADALARIHTDTLVWTGASNAPGAVAQGGAGGGSGRLQIDARRIEFGFTPDSRPDTIHNMDRLVLGFGAVALNASERVTANHKGGLAVYQSQSGWDAALKGYRYSGGDLAIHTPLLTGQAGSVNRIKAGGALTVAAPAGAAAPAPAPGNAALAESFGAELALDGASVALDTAVLLPSGKLTLSAERDVLLGDAARLDLAGRKIDFFDTSKYSWGGDVVLDSRNGDVRQAAGSSIDLSAQHNRAGKLGVTAVGAGAGTVDLRGSVAGAAGGSYDAGGTLLPFAAGCVDIRAQRLEDFAGLNRRLNAGKVFGARAFQLKQGDLVVGDELKAREVSVALDAGHLTVAGRIDASGEQVGGIRLAGRDGVTVQAGAALDAHGSVLRRDSYGQVIEAPNRAVVEIASSGGRLTLEGGARLDLRSGDQGGNYGSVELNARRLGGVRGGDLDIDAAGSVRIDGARGVTVNGFWRYDDAPAGTGQVAGGRPYQSVTQAYLDRKHDDSAAFIKAALANGNLMDHKLKGLRGDAAAFHLRPGVEIVSATPDGDVHVDGDVDLSGQRYAGVNPGAQIGPLRGSGEAGALVLRAGGKLSVFGSISDGFDGSALPATADDSGWILPKGLVPWGGDVVVPHAGLVTLAEDSYFKSGRTLNYALPMKPMALRAGTLLAAPATLTAPLQLPAGSVLGGAVRKADGSVLLAAGSVLQQALTLEGGMRLDAGLRLPAAAAVAAMLWPAGVALPFPDGQPYVNDGFHAANGVVLASALTLAKGALIPGETDVRLPGGAEMVALRPADGAGGQGRNWALAPMLAAGSQSWSLRLVGGADTAAADTRAVRPHAKGADLQLADAHYGMVAEKGLAPGSGLPGQYVWGPDAAVIGGGAPGDPINLADYGTEEEVLGYNDWGYGVIVVKIADGTPPVYIDMVKPVRQQLFSVLRTGTGDLDLVAGGDFDMSSLYGVYTAGTQSAQAPAGAADPYNLPRGYAGDGTLLGADGAKLAHLVDGGTDSLYRAWYPEHGGNLLLRAGGDVKGDTVAANGQRRKTALGFLRSARDSSAVGAWLWRQGSGSAIPGAGVPTAWWINFGTYVAGAAGGDDLFQGAPFLTGFTGVGTLGGGNLLLEAGGDAGMLDARADPTGTFAPRSQGLNVAVASTGRVTPEGRLLLTGGGDLDVRIGGGLNPVAEVRGFASGGDNATPQTRFDAGNPSLNSSFTNLRGALRLQAGAVGGVELRFDRADPRESRPHQPYTATTAIAGGGPVLVPGDSGVRIDARGDLVLGGVGDPGRVGQYHNGTPFHAGGVDYKGEGWSWFSLWTPATAVDLFSAGGNLTPTMAWSSGGAGLNASPTDGRFVMPSVLRAVAASGSLYYGNASKGGLGNNGRVAVLGNSVMLAPSPRAPQFVRPGTGQLEMLAAGSIYAAGSPLTQSGADPAALPSPFNPGFVGAAEESWFGARPVSNVGADALAPSPLLAFGMGRIGANVAQRYPLFSLTPPTVSDDAPVGQAPARFYAVDGDIVGLRSGSIVYRGSLLGRPTAAGLWYEGGGPVAVRAGRDIVDSGTRLGEFEEVPQEALGWRSTPLRSDPAAPHKPEDVSSGTGRGNLFVHRHADDVSLVSAGRDIRNSSFYVAGPGLLEVSAGRDLYMADKAEIKSIGPVASGPAGGRAGGASIAVAAGVGRNGPDYAAFAARYLDPARLADPARPLAEQAGSAVYVYDGELTLAGWLRGQFGYGGDAAGASAFLQGKQAELETAARRAGAAAPRRDLAREYGQVSQLHLVNWLGARFGAGNGQGLRFDPATDARAFFAKLAPEQQRAYLRNVYYAELKAAGREYNDADGQRRGSYLRGREAAATLFPALDGQGNKRDYRGDLTMFSSALYTESDMGGVYTRRPKPGVKYLSEQEWVAAGMPTYEVAHYVNLDGGIHTDFGGDIGVMAPGGRALVGVDGGAPPGEGSGLLTQGSGDIQIYAQGSVLLGQSRVFTTFGGDILAWSAGGDINAGRGAKSTVVYTPQRRVYDGVGLVSLSPSTPSTGAGIATLNPIPEVPPGDIDLIAPLGTIDAGEAGIRVSGNVNLAALQVANAANVQVQGKSAGLPVVAAVNVGALSNASAAAGQGVAAAQDVLQRERAAARQALPSVFTVKVLGFGADADAEGKGGGKEGGEPQASAYRPDGVVRVLGAGALAAPQLQALTPGERRGLQP